MSQRDNSPLLLVSETAQSTMTAAAVRAHPEETGGILIGVQLNGQPWVTAAIEIASTDRGRHHYKIPSGATQPAVYAARRVDHRVGYLGDWHTHPSDVRPSPTDLATLALISVRHPRTPNPTLVVVRNTVHGYALDARRIVAIAPRACELRLAGNVPLAEPRQPDHGASDPDDAVMHPDARLVTPDAQHPGVTLTSNQMPSASGVRIAGDDYQWLHAWRMCMEALHENLTGNSTNPAVAVGVEEAGVGNGDDVVHHRVQPPNVYMQVKYAVDNRTAVNLDYLDESGVLLKMVKAYRELTADGTPVEMRLVTNRTIDPNDVLLRDRDGRDGRLLPRAKQGSPKSERGKARADWAAKAETDEPALIEFLSHFHLDVAYELDRLRRDVSLLMTANGLRSDAPAVSLGADWVSQQVVAGHRRLSITHIKDAISTLNLQVGSPWRTISIATIKRDQVAHQAAVAIDWIDRISGDTDWTRVEPAPPATWDDLAADVRTVPHRLAGNKRILVSGHMRQATGFLVGSELRRVMGYVVGVRQGDQLWTSEEPTNGYSLTLAETVVDAGSDTAVIVNVAADAAEDAIGWIRETALPVSKVLTATPTAGVGPRAVHTPSAANSLAVTIRDLARRHSRTGQVHLFLSGPLGLAVLLGHHWNRVTTTHVYEHLGGPDYVHAFTVEA